MNIKFTTMLVYAFLCTSIVPQALAGPVHVRVEFPGKKLAAERKGKRIDFMQISPGEAITIKATGPLLINIKICRMFKKGEKIPGFNTLVVASDDGLVARQKLTMRPGRGAPLPFDRKLVLSKRRTYQLKIPGGDHVYVVTADPGPGIGLAVQITKTRKHRKRTLVFEKPATNMEIQHAVGVKQNAVNLEETAGASGLKEKSQGAAKSKAASPKSKTGAKKPFGKSISKLESRQAAEKGNTAAKQAIRANKENENQPVSNQVSLSRSPAKKEKSRGVGTALFWTTATAAVVSALVSGGVRVWYRQEDAAYQKKLRQGATPDQVRSRRDKMVNLERVYVGFAGAAGLFAVTAGISAIFTDWNGGEQVAVTPYFEPVSQTFSLSCRIKF
ncbi:MAG: hypothetical protein GXP49_14130 [Deltaproteobacteria bacterium]|nr:hypothetical protein [Deltaproteobacteria bacterium]